MRIVAGAWRGRALVTPPGHITRPTADRVRQALFDILMHAAWCGRAGIENAVVLDAFAGTGALGLEALSRGAAFVCFIEQDAAALRALRANVAACQAAERVRVLAADVLAPPANARARPGPAGAAADQPASLVFLDPPYGQNLVPRAIASLTQANWLAPDALIVAETGRDEDWLPRQTLLAERQHGAARLLAFRRTDQ